MQHNSDYYCHACATEDQEQLPVIDLRDRCVGCAQDTGYGSGRFVNRIPSDGVWDVDGIGSVIVCGWMCAECQLIECPSCGEEVWDIVEHMEACQ